MAATATVPVKSAPIKAPPIKPAPGFAGRVVRTLIFIVCTFLLFQFVSLYLSWPKQAVLGGLTLVIALVLNRISKAHLVSLALMLLSLAATLRYGWWRIHLVANFFTDESNHRFSIDGFLMLVLLSAEAYTFGIMVLGYMQTSWILHRKPIPLPADEALWPHVDVLIPTYNEPLSLVRYTALAAINIDYPPEKLHVYILDDGTREDFRLFAKAAGVGYITREKHNHAKAGNINHALTKMTSPLVAIFDCDHVPTRSFLQFTAGWFLVDPKLAMLQTPHFFYSPDPFERNLLQYKSIPNEGELFYGIIQDGNDFWNATFFCGSCAVLRRVALDSVGGIATETVTEDAHTSLRMQSRGWNTAYINVPQAAGLATETLAGHVGQRVRWARGMIQILRTNNPLLVKGMKFTQRLCYFNAMLHFMYAVPRLIFLLAPLAYMLLGRTIIPGYWVAILAYALPHLIISSLTNSRMQGRHRHSFWNEIYETVLAPYILLPTLLALINPKLGKFNVTDKGTTLDETRFDRKIAAPTTWLLLANFAGVLVVPYRLFVLDPQHPGVIISNLFWILFNMVILGVAAAVAHEQRQRRSSVRIPARIPVQAKLRDGRILAGVTRDMSVGGASIALPDCDAIFQSGDVLHVFFPAQTGDAKIRCTVVGVRSDEVRIRFTALSLNEQETLTRALYSRADSWIHGHHVIELDQPMVSFGRIVRLSLTGLKQVALGLIPRRSSSPPAREIQPVSTMLLLVACLACTSLSAQTAKPAGSGHSTSSASFPPAAVSLLSPPPGPMTAAGQGTPGSSAVAGSILTRISLKDMGVEGAAEMRGPHSYSSVHFTLPHTQNPRRATFQLSYHFDRSLSYHAGKVVVRLNNTLLSEIQSPAGPQDENVYAVAEIPVTAELLVRDNDLSFEFTGNSALPAGKDAQPPVLARIGAGSAMEIGSDPIPLSNDLSLLPLPIYDNALQTTTTIPFVFLTQPDARTLQAAGVVASWFGTLASTKPVRFSVSIGVIPRGNVVLFVNKGAGGYTAGGLPESLAISSAGPSLTIAGNPADSLGSALVVAGNDDNQLLAAAQALAMRKGPAANSSPEPAALEGSTLQVSMQNGGFALPAPREPDDAPRWLPGDGLVPLWKYSAQPGMQSDGSQPIPVYFHVAPDLYYGETQNLRLAVAYRYNAAAIAPDSALRMYVNGDLINEAPLAPGAGFSDGVRQAFLPVASMRPFGNTLRFNFDFVPRPTPGAGNGLRLQGSILQNSSLDLRGLDHWAAMPNLELFANAGFPFTRLADLGSTTVILPARPSAKEIALFLHLMSHCGTQTGYPALRVEVAGPNEMASADRDYLVLGTIANQPAFTALQGIVPVSFDADGIHVKPLASRLSQFQIAWRKLFNRDAGDTLPQSEDGIPGAVIEGIESPYGSGRSLVMVALRDDGAEDEFAEAFFSRSQSSDIEHSVSLLLGNKFVSYQGDTAEYHIGDVSYYTIMRIWLTEHFLLLLVAVSLCSLVLASGIYDYLRRRAALRLQLEEVARS